MMERFDNTELDMEQLEQVSGGRQCSSARTVEAVCGHCGDNGPHPMDSGWTAICRKCGKPINLKAQA